MKTQEGYITKIKELIQNKRCILYGFAATGRNFLLNFEHEGIDVDYIVDQKYEQYNTENIDSLFAKKYPIKSPYDLAYEQKGEITIFVAVDWALASKDISAFLNSLGFEHQKDYWFCGEIVASSANTLDPTLGYTRANNHIPGMECYGNPNAKHRLVTLGGSTTDPTSYLLKSWPLLLYEKFTQNYGIDVCIYNAGMGGYDSSQELLKLIRDIVPLHPDIVISYSGYNDLVHMSPFFPSNKYPYVSLYMQNTMKSILPAHATSFTFGAPCEKSAAQLWVDNEKMMHAICVAMGIQFRAVLQPCLICPGPNYVYSETEKKRTLLEPAELFDIFPRFYRELDEMHIFSDWLIDGRGIFDSSTDIYLDRCHVNADGNALIATFVENLIKTLL